MTKVIGVRFRQAGKIYFFSPGKLEIKPQDRVIVETARGVEFGKVVTGPKEVEDDKITQPLKSVIRIANEEDYKKEEKNREKEKIEFGGILIRSLLKIKDNNEEIIYGPLCCKDVLLNEAKELPSLEYFADKRNEYNLKASKRVGISNENTDLNLRYYAQEYETKEKASVSKRWAYKNGDIHQVKGQSYNISDKK